MRSYKRKPNPFTKNQDFLARLKAQPTLADKRSQIVEANPLFYCLGTNLNPRNPYEGEQHGQD